MASKKSSTSKGSVASKSPAPKAGTNGKRASKRRSGYKVGDQVVYPHHGVATIEKIEDKDVLGEKRQYLVLRLDAGDLTLMVPAESVEEVGIRNLIDKGQVDGVLKVLRKGEVTDNAENWSRRFKANQEKLRSGDIQSVAEVVRNLSIRERQKGLSTGEKRMLNRAREILAGEIAVALDVDAEAAEEVLEKALK
ncbi:MAG TPA: CarD family transcriptional regulator [Actinomycetota bacterium]|nr:CarD family transcriptional regulator [Actinomycetota bacterium]